MIAGQHVAAIDIIRELEREASTLHEFEYLVGKAGMTADELRAAKRLLDAISDVSAETELLRSCVEWAFNHRAASRLSARRAIDLGVTGWLAPMREAVACKALGDLFGARAATAIALERSTANIRSAMRAYDDQLAELISLVYTSPPRSVAYQQRHETQGSPELVDPLKLKIALFLKTYPGDNDRLRYLFSSIDRYTHGFSELVVVTEPGHKLDRLPQSLPVNVFEAPVPALNWNAMRGAGYWHQQSIKMSWNRFSSADAVLVLDSDFVLASATSPVDFFEKDQPVWIRQRRPENHDGLMWRLGSDYFVGQPTTYSYMCVPAPIVTRTALDGYTRYVCEVFGCEPYDFFLSSNSGVSCSEYETFGAYLQFVNSHGYVFREPGYARPDVRLYQSVLGLPPEKRLEIARILGVDDLGALE